MAKVGSAYITAQPHHQDILNSFALMGNEVLLHQYMYDYGRCGCSTTYYTTLTDTRLLARAEADGCCNCCSDSDHSDLSVFLRDVAQIRESTPSRHCCTPCFKTCCGCCSSPSHKIQIRGIFGHEQVYIPEEDTKIFLLQMPLAIANHKLVKNH